MKATRLLTQLVAMALVLGATTASAAVLGTISGEIGMFGTYQESGGTGLEDATGLSSASGGVIAGTGDFAAFIDDTVSFTAFNFEALPTAPLFETSGGLSFTITDLSIALQTATALDITGIGYYSAAGFTNTPGTFVYTSDLLGGIRTFSATGAEVPVPGALVLFLSALGTLGAQRRARRR